MALLTPQRNLFCIILFSAIACLSACTVGPDYKRPSVTVPATYKEARNKDWKIAQPSDQHDRGAWWEVFHNPELNSLEERVNISNQNIALAEAQYRQAVALVGEAEASFVPTLGASTTVTREKQAVTSGSVRSLGQFTDYQAVLTASWEPDIWGLVRRQVESSKATAQADAAQIAAVRLSTQGTLAQDYFQLRTLDRDQKLLDDTVVADQKSLKLTQNRFNAGVASQSDVLQAETVLKTVQAEAIDNRLTRAQLEHAIAVLLGQPPANFSLPPRLIAMNPPNIPLQVPSALLERRPDIAQAERNMAAANAQIGVAIAAYYPTLMLSPNIGYETTQLQKWFTQPSFFWAVGPQIAETLFDGGLRKSTTAAARAVYEQNIATYRQTVFAAFQDVEDNLAAQRILTAEAAVQKQADIAAQHALKIMLSNYASGTAAYTDVIVSQGSALTAEKNYYDVVGRRMVASVGLIKALGGGWEGLEN